MEKIKLNICYFDLESTGLSTQTSYILQIAGICNKNNETFQSYILPPPNFIITNSDIHHITQETLQTNNATQFAEAIQAFKDWIASIYKDEIVYLIAHNNFGYDQLLFESQCSRYNVNIPMNWRFYDSLYQFRKYNPKIGYGNYSLGKLYDTFIGEEIEGEFHNAITDVKALMKVHEKLTCEKFKKNVIYKEIIEEECKRSTINIDWNKEPLERIIHNNDRVIKHINTKGFQTVGDLLINYRKISKMKASFEKYLEIMGITSKIIRSKITNQLKHIHSITG